MAKSSGSLIHGKPYLKATRKGARTYYYFVMGSMRERIKGEPGTAEFDAAYWAIRNGKHIDAKTSWNAAIDRLRNSDKWADFSPRYRKDLEPVLAYIAEKVGQHEVSRLTPADIYAAMDANKHRVRFANYLPVTFALLAAEAIRAGWIKTSPAAGIERLRMPKHKRKAHEPWPDWAVAKFRAESGPLERLIFEVGIGSVQRPADWCALTWADYDGTSLRVVQGKTGKALTLPCTAQLREALDAERAKALALPSVQILRRDGKPLNYRTMAWWMLQERKRLGLEAYDLHALRYRGVMELAWAGCTDDEIAAFSGHETLAMIRKYAGEARQIMRARKAAEKREGR
ncbi:site-specific integrase [Rhodobacter lacus]|uniref:Tyrosine recombinase XerC n=1 Tax=Rhodobacter lacus TaxID=1641972 RepID=A0ABW5A7X2_9RHOB